MFHRSIRGVYSAIDVRRSSDAFLKHSKKRGGVDFRELPTASVTFPFRDVDRVAILSYRWDYHPELQVSRNLEVAICQAKRMGLNYLLMDRLSIDQNLTDEQLAQEIIAYATLYEMLPVICAYDEVGIEKFKFHLNMRRLWIMRELKALFVNHTKAVYVGHIPDQGTHSEKGSTYLDGAKYDFEHVLHNIWASTYARSILYLLDGQIGMTEISDLRYIMPEHRAVLDVAYKTMSRNDYLLTAAILAQVFARDPQTPEENGDHVYAPQEYRLNSDQDMWTSSYERYSRGGATQIHEETSTDILLDGRKVATWAFWDNWYTGNSHAKLIPAQDAERTVFERLGLTESDYLQYKSREEMRWEAMKTKWGEDVPKNLQIDVVLMQ